MKRLYRYLVVALVVVLTVAGCQRRPLLDPNFTTELRVVINTRSLQNVMCDIYNPNIPLPKVEPDMLRVLFYEPGQDKIAGESYISSLSTDVDGNRVISGRVGVLPGEYEMVIYNFDVRSTQIRNDHSHGTIEAYSDPVSEVLSSRFNTRAGQRLDIRYQPDHLLVATSPREYIPWHEEIHTIHAEASSIIETFYLQAKVEGLEYVSSAQAVISGVSGSNLLGERKMVESPEAAVYFTLVKSDDKGVPVVCNTFNTFGRLPNSKNLLYLTFDIHTVDGRAITKEFEISNLFESKECLEHKWLLLEETIVIPPPSTPPTSGGGFSPEVGDWNQEDHDIIL